MNEVSAVQIPLPLRGWEKGTRIALGAAGVAIGLVAAYMGLPYLVEILRNGVIAFGYALTLGAMGLATAITVPIVKNLWPFIKTQQQVIALAIAEGMIDRDPRRWIKIYITDHKRQLGVLIDGATQSNKGLLLCKRKREEQSEELADYRSKATAALKAGDKATAIRWSRMAERREKSLARLNKRIQILEFIVRALKKMRTVLENKIADEEDELNSIIEEFETSKEVERGVRAGMSVLAPDESQQVIKERAVEAMLDQVFKTHAELEMALDVFQPIIAASDLEDEVALERLNAAFEQWEQSGDIGILGPGGKQLLLAETFDPSNVLLDELGQKEKLPVVRRKTATGFDNLIDG